jgi:hypothetical protein
LIFRRTPQCLTEAKGKIIMKYLDKMLRPLKEKLAERKKKKGKRNKKEFITK